jgi:hypothetical protein
MSILKLRAQTALIPAGKTDSAAAVFSAGARLRFIALPTTQDGKMAMTGKNITFKGAMNGQEFFSVLDYSGKILEIPLAAAQQNLHIPNFLATSPAHLPIANAVLFEGIEMLIVSVDQPQKEDQKLTLYFES